VSPAAERVLTLRELNRGTLARQLLLERKRLSPKAVIERLVGMQAQAPQAPYVGIWTRTTSFRREALERELARGAVVKANLMRQTLHLVADRTRVLPEEHRKKVIRMNGDVAQTFLVDGFVAGIWRVEDGRVAVEPFSALPGSAKRELDDEAGRLEAFLAD
jgi:DNA glycosylase AlkZ-like